MRSSTGHRSLRSAMQAVADALTAHGFAAHAEGRNDQLRIINDHCPFGDVATDHPVICAVDRGMVRGMLERAVRRRRGRRDVTTESSSPAGDTFCTTSRLTVADRRRRHRISAGSTFVQSPAGTGRLRPGESARSNGSARPERRCTRGHGCRTARPGVRGTRPGGSVAPVASNRRGQADRVGGGSRRRVGRHRRCAPQRSRPVGPHPAARQFSALRTAPARRESAPGRRNARPRRRVHRRAQPDAGRRPRRTRVVSSLVPESVDAERPFGGRRPAAGGAMWRRNARDRVPRLDRPGHRHPRPRPARTHAVRRSAR